MCECVCERERETGRDVQLLSMVLMHKSDRSKASLVVFIKATYIGLVTLNKPLSVISKLCCATNLVLFVPRTYVIPQIIRV